MIKPIRVTYDQDVSKLIREATMEGIEKVVRLAWKRNPIENLEDWCAHSGPFGSMKWYINESFDHRRNQMRADKLLGLFQQEPWQRNTPHYDIQITNWDLTCLNPDGGNLLNFCLGYTVPELGVVLSGFRFQNYDPLIQRELVITLTMHEMAHLFGLVSRNFEVTTELGTHCVNKCIMRQGLNSKEWLKMTEDRLNGPEFCPTCLRELRS